MLAIARTLSCRIAQRTWTSVLLPSRNPRLLIHGRFSECHSLPRIMIPLRAFALSQQKQTNDTHMASSSASSQTGLSSVAVPALPIGVASGTVGTLMGVGGALLMVPLLTQYCNFKQLEGNATALLANISTTVTGAVAFALNGQINVPVAIIVTLTAAISTRFGARFSNTLSDKTLRKMFAYALLAFAPLIALKPLLSTKQQQQQQNEDISTTTSADITTANNNNNANSTSLTETSSNDTHTVLSDAVNWYRTNVVDVWKRWDMKDLSYLSALGCVVGFASGVLGFGAGTF